jgi:GT2 family glycosyltransferase
MNESIPTDEHKGVSGDLMPSCCLLILNYNGQEHLKDCLPSALDSAAALGRPCPVVVVDNRSTEDDITYIGNNFPSVEVVIAKANDYLFSLNDVVAERTEEIVVILNNDMHFDQQFVAAMLPHFRDPDLFAVTARVFDWEGVRLTTGQRLAEVRNFWFYREWRREAEVPCRSLDAGGGCAAFRRSMFLELGGFNTLYRPAYWEDTDLSYRAWRRGWKVLYEPASIIYHRIGATLDETEGGTPAVTRLIRRNEILFALRNVGNWWFVAGFLFLLPVRMARHAFGGNHEFWCGALQALPRVPHALAQRWLGRKAAIRSDREFLADIRRDGERIASCGS